MDVAEDAHANGEEILFEAAGECADEKTMHVFIGDVDCHEQEPQELLSWSSCWAQAVGPVDTEFDVFGSTNRIRGDKQRKCASVDGRTRRILWAVWLGVVKGGTPRSWLAEIRGIRTRLAALLQTAEERNDRDAWQLRSAIDLDVMRCFQEIPYFQTGEARGALRQVLLGYTELVQLSRSSGTSGAALFPDESTAELSYRQGFHELAAVMLWVCWEGSWSEDDDVPPQPDSAEDVNDDALVYAELATPEAVIADATVLLYTLLHRTHLVHLFDAQGVVEVKRRCRGIMDRLHELDPNLARQVCRWGIEPHVLFLRWFRLLFIRELKFPEHALSAWDALFADACAHGCLRPLSPAVRHGGAAEADNRDADSAEDPLPLADFLALAMILEARPEVPERLLRFGEYESDVFRLLVRARALYAGDRGAEVQQSAASQQANRMAAEHSDSLGHDSASDGPGNLITSGSSSVRPATSSVSAAFPMPPPPRLQMPPHPSLPGTSNQPSQLTNSVVAGGRGIGQGSQAMPAHAGAASNDAFGAPQEQSGSTIFSRAFGWAASQLEGVVRDSAGRIKDPSEETVGSPNIAPRRPPGYMSVDAAAAQFDRRSGAHGTALGYNADESADESLANDIQVKDASMRASKESTSATERGDGFGGLLPDISSIRNAVAGLEDYKHLKKPDHHIVDLDTQINFNDLGPNRQRSYNDLDKLSSPRVEYQPAADSMLVTGNISSKPEGHEQSSSERIADVTRENSSQNKGKGRTFTHKIPSRNMPPQTELPSNGRLGATNDAQHIGQQHARSGHSQAVPSRTSSAYPQAVPSRVSSGYPQAVPSDLSDWRGSEWSAAAEIREASETEPIFANEGFATGGWQSQENHDAVGSTSSAPLPWRQMEIPPDAVDLKGYNRMQKQAPPENMSYDDAFDEKGFASAGQHPGFPSAGQHPGFVPMPQHHQPFLQGHEAWYQNAVPPRNEAQSSGVEHARGPGLGPHPIHDQSAMSGRLADAIRRLERDEGSTESVLQELRAIQAQMHWDGSVGHPGGPSRW